VIALLSALFGVHLGCGLALRAAPGGAALRLAWAWLVASTVVAALASGDLPAGGRFLVLSVSVFLAMKAVCHASARRRGFTALRPGAWLAYAFLGVGMQPAPFARWGGPTLPGSARRLLAGLVGTALGLGAWLALAAFWRAGAPAVLVGALQLVGAFLLLRFGVFRAGAGALGLFGVEVGPVFRAPERARSLAELWSTRWNRPFSEMLQLAVHRPLRARHGAAAARAAAFVFSGALHEVALSLPVRAGFGLPAAYFLLHGALVALEARWRTRGNGPERWGARGRAWTLACALLPAVLVFHPAFVRGVLLPLLGPRG
jgi:alginate O-acetyltransferase complex protein AlgI